MERPTLTIAVAGDGQQPRIVGPEGAVICDGSTLVLQGIAVEARTGNAVHCQGSEGHAELSWCRLTSPRGSGLSVDGATVTMDGGAIQGCRSGVFCHGPGSTATVCPHVCRRLVCG